MSLPLAGPYHFYRREEHDPGVYDLRNGTPEWEIEDQGLDLCRGYFYLATVAEMEVPAEGTEEVPTGRESGNSPSVAVNPYLVARQPVPVMAMVGEPPVQLAWDGLSYCPDDGEYYNVVGFQLMRQDSLEVTTTLSYYPRDGAGNFPVATDDPGPGIYWYWLRPKYEHTEESNPNPVVKDGPGGIGICRDGSGQAPDPNDCNWQVPPHTSWGPDPDPPSAVKPRMHKITDPTVEWRGPGRLTDEDWRLAWRRAIVGEDAPTIHHPDQVEVASLPAYPGPLTGPLTRPREAPYVLFGSGGMPGSPDARGIRTTYLHADHLGTTRLGTLETPDPAAPEEEKWVAFETASMPFGEVVGATKNTSFAGHRRSAGSRTIYMMARYYSPALARFLSPDPLLSPNRFAYANDNPVTLIDPDGMAFTYPFKKRSFLRSYVTAYSRSSTFRSLHGKLNNDSRVDISANVGPSQTHGHGNFKRSLTDTKQVTDLTTGTTTTKHKVTKLTGTVTVKEGVGPEEQMAQLGHEMAHGVFSLENPNIPEDEVQDAGEPDAQAAKNDILAEMDPSNDADDIPLDDALNALGYTREEVGLDDDLNPVNDQAEKPAVGSLSGSLPTFYGNLGARMGTCVDGVCN